MIWDYCIKCDEPLHTQKEKERGHCEECYQEEVANL